MEMRISAIITALLLASGAAFAQETQYFLPSTSITLEVEAQQETFFAGPYAAFAKRLLNIDVKKKDDVSTYVTSVAITPHTEADLKASYTVEGDVPELLTLSAQGLVSFGDKKEAASPTWRFLPEISSDYTSKAISSESKTTVRIVYKDVPTDTSFVRVPVEQKFDETKTIEDKAQEAANLIISLRKQRMDIASGNTDATFSGEALQHAIDELRSIEEDYLTLFRGYSITREISATFDVIPQATLKNQRYLAFRADPERGLVSNGRGTPYYIELEVQPVTVQDASDKKKGKGQFIHYRIPATCKLTLTKDGTPLVETRVPVYQLGKESTYPVKIN